MRSHMHLTSLARQQEAPTLPSGPCTWDVNRVPLHYHLLLSDT